MATGAQVQEECQGRGSEPVVIQKTMWNTYCVQSWRMIQRAGYKAVLPLGLGGYDKVSNGRKRQRVWSSGEQELSLPEPPLLFLGTCFSDTCWQTQSLPRRARLPVRFFQFGQEASLHPIKAPTAALAWR